jgi:hypothetical protein
MEEALTSILLKQCECLSEWRHSPDEELTGEHSRNEDEYALYQSGGGIRGSRLPSARALRR